MNNLNRRATPLAAQNAPAMLSLIFGADDVGLIPLLRYMVWRGAIRISAEDQARFSSAFRNGWGERVVIEVEPTALFDDDWASCLKLFLGRPEWFYQERPWGWWRRH